MSVSEGHWLGCGGEDFELVRRSVRVCRVTVTTTSPDAAVRLIPPGSRVLATPSCATPATLLRALGDATAEIPDLTLLAGMLLGDQPWLDAVRASTLAMRTWHVMGEQRTLVRDGVIDYVPIRASDVPGWLPGRFDVFLVRVSPPDDGGFVSFGPSASWNQEALAAASMVIAEIDPGLPFTNGDTQVHLDAFAAVVEVDTETRFYHSAPTNPISDRIAARVLELLPLDPVVQLGIGAVPETVAASLHRASLGKITLVGMGCDAMLELVDADRFRRTPLLHSVELLGTQRLLDAAHRNPAIEMLSSSRCHDPLWLATQPRLVSINTAVEIDLAGQVASEMVAGNVVAGIGGSFDFFEGAHGSVGGLRVVALQSTTADGRTSKIVPRLAAGTAVTIPRHTVDAVVTEHGVARLVGLSMRERAEALIAIAHPDVRDELEAASSS